jgi:hypothetical protein
MGDINKDKFEDLKVGYGVRLDDSERSGTGFNVFVVHELGGPEVSKWRSLPGAQEEAKKLNEAFRLGYRAALMEKA